jgi:NADH-quinone oxidoreductase subunit A
MYRLVGYLLLFAGVGVFFLFFHLLIGKLIRPNKPDPDKLTIYECGEPTIGSAWIQFDLRFYVVALLFVIFDVEVAFFFPWAVVFGKANTLAQTEATAADRPTYNERVKDLVPNYPENQARLDRYNPDDWRVSGKEIEDNQKAARQIGWFAFWDILVFFGVLLVGFAYLWKRGDLDWVRSTAAERTALAETKEPLPPPTEGLLVGSGRGS